MTFADIKAAFISVMKTKYPTYKYYSNSVVEKFKRPSFFTELTLDRSEPASSDVHHFLGTFSIEILQDVVDEAAAYNIFTTLQGAFGTSVMVGTRSVKVVGYDFEFAGTEDNIPVITVNLGWYDVLPKTSETYPLMEAVDLDLEMEEEVI
jgi:hypothetical protein